jgi:DNA polymerase-3 subunit delta
MALYKRKDIPLIVKKAAQGDPSQVYLLHGERFLCRNAADELLDCLLPVDQYSLELRTNHLHEIDGDQEDFNRTLNMLRTYSLFPGPQVLRVTDTKLFHSKSTAKTLWDKVCKAFAAKELSSAGRYLSQFLEIAGISTDDLQTEDISGLSSTRWRDLFGFAKPAEKLGWLKEIIDRLQDGDERSGSAAEQSPAAADRFIKAFEQGVPAANILLLLTETVDKRNRFYKFIKEHYIILDLTVASGGSKAARSDQEGIIKDLLQKTLSDFDKKITPKGLGLLLERVGFHPVAAVKETEKLALYTGDTATITEDDVNDIIGRTREEALYELTEALTGQRLDEALTILGRLLEGGIHPLAILATLRNHLKKMLLIRSAQRLDHPQYSQSMSFPVFQKQYLPSLKEGREDWSMLWAGHPYGLFLLSRQTARFSTARLQNSLTEILAAEYRLKGSSLPNRLVLENLLFKLIPVEAAEVRSP